MATENNLFDDVGVLKGKVEALIAIADKMDVIIERLVDLQERNFSKVYDVIESRRMENQDQMKRVHERIDDVLTKIQDTESKLTQKIESLHHMMSEQEKRQRSKFDDYAKWKWLIVGGIFAVVLLTSHQGADILMRLFVG